uniref:lasso peptide biosynthesis B2 protein n=1 Tax=Eubacterium cellulosolvens TaxID=29322 RepID=UPI00048476D4|nr:lasso peptide biosynthesis B2 protein [[Eubacterium] cellulosolvens]
MGRIYRFFRYNRHRSLAVKVYLYSAWYRALILAGRSRALILSAGVRGEESPDEESADAYKKAAVIGYEINRICGHTLWKSLCLVQALTAAKLLRQAKVPATMYLGVGQDEKEGMIAHAWVRCGRLFVTGGDGENLAVVDKIRVGGE